MRKSLLAVGFLSTALLAGGLGAAAGHAQGMGGHLLGHGPFARLIQARIGRMITLRAELNLTDQQREAVKAALQSDKPQIVTAIKPVVEAHRALRDAVLADKADDAAIRKAADDLGKRIGDAAVALAKVKADVAAKANLTPEQKKKIEHFRAANDASVDEFFAQAAKAR